MVLEHCSLFLSWVYPALWGISMFQSLIFIINAVEAWYHMHILPLCSFYCVTSSHLVKYACIHRASSCTFVIADLSLSYTEHPFVMVSRANSMLYMYYIIAGHHAAYICIYRYIYVMVVARCYKEARGAVLSNAPLRWRNCLNCIAFMMFESLCCCSWDRGSTALLIAKATGFGLSGLIYACGNALSDLS